LGSHFIYDLYRFCWSICPVVDISKLSPEEVEAFEERAAIREFDGKEPQDLAERRALQEILEKRNNENE